VRAELSGDERMSVEDALESIGTSNRRVAQLPWAQRVGQVGLVVDSNCQPCVCSDTYSVVGDS
jgi:hypothetical protein